MRKKKAAVAKRQRGPKGRKRAAREKPVIRRKPIAGRKPKKKKVPGVSAEARGAVLLALRQAGGRGLRLGQLGCKRAGDARHRALRALAGEGEAVVFGDGRDALAVLAERAPTAEAVAKKIESRASMKRGAALGREDLAAWCNAAEEYLLDAALRVLVKAGSLITLRRGELVLYAHAKGLGAAVPVPVQPERAPEPEKAVGHDVRFRIVEAYRRLVERDGFGDVVIAELRREAGMPQEELASWLLEQSRFGRAHLGRGDWSLSDEAARQAAVTAAGEPHLRVRLVI